VHVLCEKPMAVTVDECQRMIDACDEHGVKLMIAYRLHFEEINLKAVDLVRRGRIGVPMTSFNASDVASYRIVGTKGQLHVDPAYEYAEGLAYEMTVNGKVTRKRLGKRDQFAPELLYFSGCILKNREPEPSGDEGLQDVRIVQALYESAETGKPVRIPPFDRSKRPTGRQRITKPGVQKPALVKVQSASEN
jgi:predicted dehydrogenase